MSEETLDLSQYSDEEIVAAVSKIRPNLILALGKCIDRGLTDNQIMRFVCMAGFSAQAMEYSKRCLKPMREWVAEEDAKVDAQEMARLKKLATKHP